MRVKATALGHAFERSRPLFSGLDFELNGGDLVALTGPSGSGKSTLLSLLARWEAPTDGAIEWMGIDTVGWVFQNPFGVPGRTVLDHAALPLVAKGFTRSESDDRARGILAKFGLEEHMNRPFGTLSGGEAQRLMLARAVAKSPSLLLVDEPTAQLDPHSANAVNEVLSGLAQPDCIVVVATHDPDTRDACRQQLMLGRRPTEVERAAR